MKRKSENELSRVREAAKVQGKELIRLRKVIAEIATMGDGIKEEIIDWSNIGKNAKYKANEAIRPRCAVCGK